MNINYCKCILFLVSIIGLSYPVCMHIRFGVSCDLLCQVLLFVYRTCTVVLPVYDTIISTVSSKCKTLHGGSGGMAGSVPLQPPQQFDFKKPDEWAK